MGEQNIHLWRMGFSRFFSLPLVALALLNVFAGTSTAQAERNATIEVGRQASYGMRREVNGSGTRVISADPSIARGWWDNSANKLRIEGLRAGRTQITFTGTYRAITVGSVLRERAVEFRDVVNVTVLARTVPVDRRSIAIQVTAGKHRDYANYIILGPQFRNTNDEDVRWRNVRFSDGNDTIASGSYDRSRLKLRVRGIKAGTTSMTLSGERLVQGGWQRVVRDLRITVAPDRY